MSVLTASELADTRAALKESIINRNTLLQQPDTKRNERLTRVLKRAQKHDWKRVEEVNNLIKKQAREGVEG